MTSNPRWTLAWLILCVALAIHIYEEATSDSFLAYEGLRGLLPWLPPFQFKIWLVDVAGAATVLTALTWLVHRQVPVMRSASYALALFAAGNAMIHLLQSLALNEAAVGVITSPLLLAASLFLLISVPERPANRIDGRQASA